MSSQKGWWFGSGSLVFHINTTILMCFWVWVTWLENLCVWIHKFRNPPWISLLALLWR
ncbi:hypothetical protein LINGRAHAP2_LOCUS23425 [Linum grandiflorum]